MHDFSPFWLFVLFHAKPIAIALCISFVVMLVAIVRLVLRWRRDAKRFRGARR